MNLAVQKKIAAAVLKCSPKKVKFDSLQLAAIKEALTRADIKDLISNGAIVRVHPNQLSHVRVRKIKHQKAKGLRKGLGSRKGTAKARTNPKDVWMAKVRLQRQVIAHLRERGRVTDSIYRELYRKIKGNFFRNRRHIKQYLEENNLFSERK